MFFQRYQVSLFLAIVDSTVASTKHPNKRRQYVAAAAVKDPHCGGRGRGRGGRSRGRGRTFPPGAITNAEGFVLNVPAIVALQARNVAPTRSRATRRCCKRAAPQHSFVRGAAIEQLCSWLGTRRLGTGTGATL